MAEIPTPAAAGHDLVSAERPAGSTGPPGDARATNGDIVVSQAWSGDIFRADLNSRYCAQAADPGQGRHARERQQVHPSAWPVPADVIRLKDFFYVPRSRPWWRTTTTTCAPRPLLRTSCCLGGLGRPQRGGIAQ